MVLDNTLLFYGDYPYLHFCWDFERTYSKSLKKEMRGLGPTDGVLLIDKPKGLSSAQVVEKVKRLLNVVKAGHTGTLDPIATGLIVVCIGKATKIAPLFIEHDKTYIATLKLGIITQTFDIEGRVVEKREIPCLTVDDIKSNLNRFVGKISQLPPIYSAVKYKGKPGYYWARKGINPQLTPREITIHYINLLEFKGDLLTIEVKCSKGTYIRRLAHDIGLALGCGAIVESLRRIQQGPFSIENATPLESLGYLLSINKLPILSVDESLGFLDEIKVETPVIEQILRGKSVKLDMPIKFNTEFVRVKDKNNTLFSIVKVVNKDILQPFRNFIGGQNLTNKC